MNLTQYIFEEYKNYKDKLAIFQKDQTFSYSELYSLILKIVKILKDLNLIPQEKIVIVSKNSPFFIASYFAIIASGAVAVPLHYQFGEDNFNFVVDSCKVRYFFLQKRYIKKLKKYGISPEIVFTDSDIQSEDKNQQYIDIFNLSNSQFEKGKILEVDEKKDLAVIIFTSGSTGIPKGVMQTHYNIISNSNSIIEYLNLKPSDRVMALLPFSYCFGTSLLHTHLRVGGQIVLNNYFMFPNKILKEINEKKCTTFAGVPSTYQILLRRSSLKKMKFPSLRLIQQAGGKLANSFIKELQEALPSTDIFIMYGQTEATARLSYLPPELLDKKLGSIGKGIPNVTLELLDKEGKQIKPGETGEIVASGDNITKGYWKEPKETAKSFRNGKLYTGDIGTIDEEGYIFLTDREKNILKVGGFRVSPKEVEDYIVKLDEVVEVGIIGINDEILGEAMKAYISLTPGAKITQKEIISYCKKKLPNQKIPKEIEFLKTLPKNNSNKLDKVKLKEMDKLKRGK